MGGLYSNDVVYFAHVWTSIKFTKYNYQKKSSKSFTPAFSCGFVGRASGLRCVFSFGRFTGGSKINVGPVISLIVISSIEFNASS